MQRNERVIAHPPVQLEEKRFAAGIVGEAFGGGRAEQGNRVDRSSHPLVLQRSPWRLAKTVLFAFIALGLLLPSVLLAQIVPTATLAGAVTDPTGAVVPSAAVQIVNTATQVTKETTADAQGRFLFSFLQPGSYQLNVSATGFNTYHQTGITLNVNAPATVNVSLEVHSASAEVTVRSNAEMIDTQSSTLHQVVGQQYLENLPLNGRNAATLVTLAPGVVSSPGEYNDSYANSGNEVAYSVNGTAEPDMGIGTNFTEQRVGGGVAFSNAHAVSLGQSKIPFDVSYLHTETISGSGGALPKLINDQILIRLYYRLRR